MATRVRNRLADATADDSGFTVIELVVVMVIMAIVLAIFTTGIQQAFSAENKTDTASSAEGQLLTAFQRLDKEIRYSTGISNPGTSTNSDPVVEFLTSWTGTATCTEIRLQLSSGKLQQRTWTQGMSPLIPGSWTQLASNITAATPRAASSPPAVVVSAPFAVSQPDSTFQFQRMEIAVTAKFGVNANATTKASDVTFTALDTTSATSSTTTCTEGRGVSW